MCLIFYQLISKKDLLEPVLWQPTIQLLAYRGSWLVQIPLTQADLSIAKNIKIHFEMNMRKLIEGLICTSYFCYFNFCTYTVALSNLELCFKSMRCGLPAFPFFFLNKPKLWLKQQYKKSTNLPSVQLYSKFLNILSSLWMLIFITYAKNNYSKRHPNWI
jgi:hypothetical protein